MDRHCRYGVSLSSHLPPGLLTGSYNVARLVVVIQSRSGGCFWFRTEINYGLNVSETAVVVVVVVLGKMRV